MLQVFLSFPLPSPVQKKTGWGKKRLTYRDKSQETNIGKKFFGDTFMQICLVHLTVNYSFYHLKSGI